MHKIYTVLVILAWSVVLWPFPMEVFLAICFAILLRPSYNFLCTRFGKKVAACCISVGLCVGIILPIAVVVLMVTPQAMNGLRILEDLQRSGWIYGPEMQAFFDDVDSLLRMIPGFEGGTKELTAELTSFLAGAIQTLVSKSLGIASGTMAFMVRLCILISLSITGVLYAPSFFNFLKAVSGIPESVLIRFEKSIRQAIRAVLWGVLLVACIQGILCGFGFAVAGLPSPAFWGLVSAFVAPIPFVGTSLVWLPVGVYIWFAVSKAAAVGLMLWCVIIVVGADNVLRPFFLRGGLKTSFMVVLIAVLCGLVALGPVGIVAGPVLAAFALQAAREAEIAAHEEKLTSNKD